MKTIKQVLGIVLLLGVIGFLAVKYLTPFLLYTDFALIQASPTVLLVIFLIIGVYICYMLLETKVAKYFGLTGNKILEKFAVLEAGGALHYCVSC